MARHRCADVAWSIDQTRPGVVSKADAQLAVLMDIRDELQSLRRLAQCHRIPRALDAMHEMGVEARAKKRRAAVKAKKAKAAKSSR